MKHPFLHGAHNAGRFQDQSVVDRYHLRPAYPPETFTILNELIVDEPRAVLDVGCGTGNVARPLTEYVEHIDAVDLSLPMLERARMLPGGDSPKIRWLHGRAEDVETQPPYALVQVQAAYCVKEGKVIKWRHESPHVCPTAEPCGTERPRSRSAVIRSLYVTSESDSPGLSSRATAFGNRSQSGLRHPNGAQHPACL
jgi:SAM-dependent methyltransferase